MCKSRHHSHATDCPHHLIKHRWHGDIKPENILDVQGRFKLADPGEACVVTDSKMLPTGPRDSETIIPTTQVPGGTVSFGTLFPHQVTSDSTY